MTCKKGHFHDYYNYYWLSKVVLDGPSSTSGVRETDRIMMIEDSHNKKISQSRYEARSAEMELLIQIETGRQKWRTVETVYKRTDRKLVSAHTNWWIKSHMVKSYLYGDSHTNSDGRIPVLKLMNNVGVAWFPRLSISRQTRKELKPDSNKFKA